MQKFLCSLAMLVTSSLPVLAADSVEAKVIGSIKPVACVPTLGGGGVFDYGVIKASDLAVDEYTLLPVKSSTFSIKCDAETPVAIQTINNRLGTLAGATEPTHGYAQLASVTTKFKLFDGSTYAVGGLGLADNNAKVGGYGVRLVPNGSTADANPVDIAHVHHPSLTSWIKTKNGGLISGSATVNTTWVAKGTLQPLAFKTLSADFQVQAYINKASELDITKPIKLDGSTTIVLFYL